MLGCSTGNKKVICHQMEAKTLLYNIQSSATGTTSRDNLCSTLPTMYILIFWKVAICSLVNRYQRFSGACHGSFSSKYQYQSTKHKTTHFKRQVTSTVTALRIPKAKNQQCNRQHLTAKTSTWHWNKMKLVYNLLKVLGVGFSHFTWNLSVRDSWNGVIARSEPRNLMSGLSAAFSGSIVTCIDTLLPTGKIKYQKHRDRQDNLVC